MPISRNQMMKNARAFSQRWADETSEKAESQTFWNEFFAIFGINRREVALFEAGLKKLKGSQGFIDVFWRGKLICEQKSRGQDLTKAYHQAIDYLQATAKVAKDDLPRYVITCDFEWLHLYDLEAMGDTQQVIIKVADLAEHLHLFSFMHSSVSQLRQEEERVNIIAAEKMGRLHDALKAIGYEGHDLEVLLIRLLFCLFAEDTQIFDKFQFENFIRNKTRADGSDLAQQLAILFQVLNTPKERRLKNLDLDLAEFEYINGELFAEMIAMASFDDQMRLLLLDACSMDWSQISPEIFGALFQSVMDKEARRALGAHYTSEENILKVVNSLFMDALYAEFELAKKGGKQAKIQKLDAFHQKIANLTFLDPACGCGNFLIVAYRELRLLELEIIHELYAKGQLLDVETLVRCDVNQFYGIEIEEFAAQIARVAMWLIDHQMNRLVSQHFGTHFARIPLKKSANIQCANALISDWASVDYILGNPPFIGHQWRTKGQQADCESVFPKSGKFGKLDYVACWYAKAAIIMTINPDTKTAFVSTNSITQGEQAGILWEYMFSQGIQIHFAHRTFKWSNEARGVAGVHCVIIGFGLVNQDAKHLFVYDDISGAAELVVADNINQYLLNAPSVILPSRSKPRHQMPMMTKGSQPTDGGFLIVNAEDKAILSTKYPVLAPYIKPFIGGNEFLNDLERYCLWFADASLSDMKQIITISEIKQRIAGVQQARQKSPTASVREFVNQPLLFTQNRQPSGKFLAVPEVSSERRIYLPIGFLDGSEVVPSNLVYILPDVGLYEFGVLSSLMHNAWMRVVAGRLESRYRYSPNVYNQFPWLEAIDEKDRQAVEQAAQAVLDVREIYAENSLAELYDPLLMPQDLLKAHHRLDQAVDKAYRKQKFVDEAERVAFLFEKYREMV